MCKVENGSWRKKDTYLVRHRDFIYLVVVVEVAVVVVEDTDSEKKIMSHILIHGLPVVYIICFCCRFCCH